MEILTFMEPPTRTRSKSQVEEILNPARSAYRFLQQAEKLQGDHTTDATTINAQHPEACSRWMKYNVQGSGAT